MREDELNEDVSRQCRSDLTLEVLQERLALVEQIRAISERYHQPTVHLERQARALRREIERRLVPSW
jgi:hypothetical protein